MSFQKEERDREELLEDLIIKIPSFRKLIGIVAISSGVFSGAWWVGLDSAPDRYTGTEARADKEVFTAAIHAQETEIYTLRKDLEETERTLWSLSLQLTEVNKRHLAFRKSMQTFRDKTNEYKGIIDSLRDSHIDTERSVRQHNEQAQKWIERIQSNTVIVLDNQKKAHRH